MLYSKTLVFALLTAGALTAPTAHAYIKKDPCDHIKLDHVKFKDAGEVLKVYGKLKGLKDKEDVKVKVIGYGEAEFMCKNPAGKYPPGKQGKTDDVTVFGWKKIKGKEVCDGTAEFSVHTDEPDPEHDGICGNAKWTTELKDISFDGATIIVEQSNCKVKFVCNFDPTDDGEVVKDADCDRMSG